MYICRQSIEKLKYIFIQVIWLYLTNPKTQPLYKAPLTNSPFSKICFFLMIGDWAENKCLVISSVFIPYPVATSLVVTLLLPTATTVSLLRYAPKTKQVPSNPKKLIKKDKTNGKNRKRFDGRKKIAAELQGRLETELQKLDCAE